MLHRLVLLNTDSLTFRLAATATLPCQFWTAFAKGSGFDRVRNTVINTTAVAAVPAPGAAQTHVVGNFYFRNPNTGTVTLIAEIGVQEILRVDIPAGNFLTEQGLFNAQGQLVSVGTAGAAAITTATSTTSVTLSTGAKTFAIANVARQWAQGMKLVAAVTGQASTRYMVGRITAVTNTSVTIDVQNAADVVGTGTAATWSIGQAADTTGSDGASFLSGVGIPSNGLGRDEDSYVNVSNGDVYKKVSGNWGSPTGNIRGPAGSSAEITENIAALPMNWATGHIKEYNLTANVSTSNGDYLNPVSGKAHVLILLNTSGSPQTFTLPNHSSHFTPSSRSIVVGNNQKRVISAIYANGAYHWAVGEELQNI